MTSERQTAANPGVKAGRLAEQVRSCEETFADRISLPSQITDATLHAEATEALGAAKYERDRDELLLGRAFDADAREGDAFSKLIRYETGLERSLFRTLFEFRRHRPPSPTLDAVTRNAEQTPPDPGLRVGPLPP